MSSWIFFFGLIRTRSAVQRLQCPHPHSPICFSFSLYTSWEWSSIFGWWNNIYTSANKSCVNEFRFVFGFFRFFSFSIPNEDPLVIETLINVGIGNFHAFCFMISVCITFFLLVSWLLLLNVFINCCVLHKFVCERPFKIKSSPIPRLRECLIYVWWILKPNLSNISHLFWQQRAVPPWGSNSDRFNAKQYTSRKFPSKFMRNFRVINVWTEGSFAALSR